MTIPYLMNCSHSGEGWCLECVKEMGEQNQLLRQELRQRRTPGPATREMLSLARAIVAMDELSPSAVRASQAFIDEWKDGAV